MIDNKYNISDFTDKNYKNILQKIKNRYNFIFYNDIKSYTADKEYLLWRHDVDFSVHRAYELAKIENELGIKSTYFLQFSSEMYNLYELEIRELVFKIIGLGHEIALHFYPILHNIKTKKELKEYLLFEKNTLERLFDIKVNVFSFHNPTVEIMKFDNFKYAGMINTYAKHFQKNVAYCSDSNGYWRHERLEEFLLKGDVANRQVLTHPVWWQKEAMNPYDRVKRCINGRAKKRIEMYKTNMKKLKRKNVK
jgi:hypothetical protein